MSQTSQNIDPSLLSHEKTPQGSKDMSNGSNIELDATLLHPQQNNEDAKSHFEHWKQEFNQLKHELKDIILERGSLLEIVDRSKQMHQEIEKKYYELQQESKRAHKEMELEIGGLNLINSSLEAQIEALKAENTELKEANGQFKQECNEAQDRLAEFKRKLVNGEIESPIKLKTKGSPNEKDSEQSSLVRWMKEIENENREILNRISSKESQRKELEKVMEEKAKLEASLAAMKTELSLQKSSFQSLWPLIEEINALISNDSQEKKKFCVDCSTYEGLRQILHSFKEQFKNLIAHAKDVEAINEDIAKRLHFATEEIGLQASEIGELRLKIKALQSEKGHVVEELRTLLKENELNHQKYLIERSIVEKQAICLEKFDKKIPPISAELESLKLENALTHEELEYQKQINQDLLKSELTDKEYQKILEQKIKKLEYQVKHLETDLDQYKNQYTSLESQHQLLQRESEYQTKELRKQIDLKDGEIEDLSNQVEAAQCTIAANEKKIERLKSENDELSQQIRSLEEQREKLERDLKSTFDYVATLENDAQKDCDRIEKLERLLEEKNREISQKEKELSFLDQSAKVIQGEMTRTRFELSKMLEDKSDIEHVVAQAQKSIGELLKELNDSKKLTAKMEQSLGELGVHFDSWRRSHEKRWTMGAEAMVGDEIVTEGQEEIEIEKSKGNVLYQPKRTKASTSENYVSWEKQMQLQSLLEKSANVDKGSGKKAEEKEAGEHDEIMYDKGDKSKGKMVREKVHRKRSQSLSPESRTIKID